MANTAIYLSHNFQTGESSQRTHYTFAWHELSPAEQLQALQERGVNMEALLKAYRKAKKAAR